MNIVAFAWPQAGYENPVFSGGDTLSNRASWMVNQVFFNSKMMSLFSMLFGAGLVLMDERARERGASLWGVYYRRTLWLLVFGLAHAYLIWWGDILYFYAACGLVLFFFRRLSANWLVGLGLVLLAISSLMSCLPAWPRNRPWKSPRPRLSVKSQPSFKSAWPRRGTKGFANSRGRHKNRSTRRSRFIAAATWGSWPTGRRFCSSSRLSAWP